jgi:hypothetical protein
MVGELSRNTHPSETLNCPPLRCCDSSHPIHSSLATRRSDNDQYAHMNNAVYYHLFDSIVNTYLIERCALDPRSSPLIGLVVSSYCQVRAFPSSNYT